MNVSRFLLALPVVFVAGLTAAACSSSSSPDTGGGLPDSGGTSGAAECATLNACCPNIPASSQATCTASVATGSAAQCASTLSTIVGAGYCKAGSSGSGTSPGSSGSGTSPPSSGSGTSPGTDAGTDGGGNTCVPTLAAGFTPVAITPSVNTTCTSAELTTIATDCFSQTGTCSATDQMSTCFECEYTDVTMTNAWGVALLLPPSGGDMYYITYPFLNQSACISAIDPTNGPACATAYTNLVQCEIASCLTNCPIATNSETDPGLLALFGTFDSTGTLTQPGCTENADTTTCMTYYSAYTTACMADNADGGAAQQCNTLAQTNIDALLAPACGGADAGL